LTFVFPAISSARDPTMRLAPNSPYFWYQPIVKDVLGGGRTRQFDFIVSDAAAVYGVLEVIYAEVTEGA
jgi:hypothetical protein